MTYDYLYNERDRLGRFVRVRPRPIKLKARKPPSNPERERALRVARYQRARQRYAYRTFRFSYEDVALLKFFADKHNESMVERLRTYMVWGFEQEEE